VVIFIRNYLSGSLRRAFKQVGRLKKGDLVAFSRLSTVELFQGADAENADQLVRHKPFDAPPGAGFFRQALDLLEQLRLLIAQSAHQF